MNDPTPHLEYEPVAYFEFDENTELTIDVDFSKQCKYIMLKPTSFRKKPTAFTQNLNSVPMEIEFFGVTGTSQAVDNIFEMKDRYSNQFNNLLSAHEIEIKITEQEKVLRGIKDIEINSIQALDIDVSRETLVK